MLQALSEGISVTINDTKQGGARQTRATATTSKCLKLKGEGGVMQGDQPQLTLNPSLSIYHSLCDHTSSPTYMTLIFVLPLIRPCFQAPQLPWPQYRLYLEAPSFIVCINSWPHEGKSNDKETTIFFYFFYFNKL